MRGCDQFGANIGLNYAGETKFGTLGGGIASFLIYTIALIVLGKQIVALVEYQDPALSSYTVMEDRSKMKEALNLNEYGLQFFACFLGQNTEPIHLDPRIGRFKLVKFERLMVDGVVQKKKTEIALRELDFSVQDDSMA